MCVCVCVCCLSAIRSSVLHVRSSLIFCACYLWPWLGPFLAAYWYLMYFRFWDDIISDVSHTHTHTHTHLSLTALFPGLPRSAGTRKVQQIWILLKQETVSGSGISWDICKSATRSRQITMPAPHHSVFLQSGCPSSHPTNSVKALKA